MSKEITKLIVTTSNLTNAITMLLDEYNEYSYVVVKKGTATIGFSLHEVYVVEGHIGENDEMRKLRTL